MKKLLVVAVVALLALALVACGGDDTATTTKGDVATTAPVVDTTAPVVVDTTAPAVVDTTAPAVVDTTAIAPDTTTPDTKPTTPPDGPDLKGVDILNGDPADMAINPTWQGMNVGAFENHHAALDMNWAYVILFTESENAIYEDLILTYQDADGNDAWMMNEDYKWVLTLNGEDIEITRFSIYHNVTSGYVRMDLGEDFELAAKNEDGTIDYEIILRIYDTTNNDAPAYYAYMTDPEWNGTHNFTPPAPIEMVEDANRDPAEKVIAGATPFSGPTGFNNELYENLFDEGKNGEIVNVQTKLCTDDVETAIVWKYDSAVYVTSYSLVGANDDATYMDRIITSFKFYGSTNGTDWTLLDEQNGDPVTEGGVSYAERNFKLATAAEYTYFKLEPIGVTKYQLSGILLWTKE